MKVTFKLTDKDIWKQSRRQWARPFLRRVLRSLAVPAFAYEVCLIAGRGKPFTTITVLVTCAVPLGAFLLTAKDLLQRMSAARAKTAEPQAAEIGQFDFRLGPENASSYYYHWTQFSDITETADELCLVLKSRQTLSIPKSAFATPASAQAFLAEARSRWQAARLIQRQIVFPQDETVWPPAPRKMTP